MNSSQDSKEAFDPQSEAIKLDQSMQQFRKEVEVLKDQANQARQKTLDSIREGILSAKARGLHQTLFPDTKPIQKMEQEQNENQESQHQEPTPQIATAKQAIEYTDDHMKQLISSMSNQLNSAMNSAQQAMSAGKQFEQQASTAIEKGVKAGEEVLSKTSDDVQQEMLKAQEAVAKTISGSESAPDSAPA